MWVFVLFAVCSPSLEKREDGKKKEVRKMGRWEDSGSVRQ
jgi:hypothetical protein